jgi:hypothetical protein
LWGTRNGTYLVGRKQRFNKHSIVVNNNIKTQYDGQFLYGDGSPVPANELIHIHADGVTMTGGIHTEDSVLLKDSISSKDSQATKQIRQTTTPTSGSGGGGY